MTSWRVLATLLLIACEADPEPADTASAAPDPSVPSEPGTPTVDTTEPSTDTGTRTGSEPGPTQPAPCVSLLEGPWIANGSAFGTQQSARVRMMSGCTFRIVWDDPELEGVPLGGDIADDHATLYHPEDMSWSTCRGLVDGSGTLVTGTCSESQTTFSMALAYDAQAVLR